MLNNNEIVFVLIKEIAVEIELLQLKQTPSQIITHLSTLYEITDNHLLKIRITKFINKFRNESKHPPMEHN